MNRRNFRSLIVAVVSVLFLVLPGLAGAQGLIKGVVDAAADVTTTTVDAAADVTTTTVESSSPSSATFANTRPISESV